MSDENQLPDQNDMQLWESYLEAYETMYKRMRDIRENASDFVALMRYGLSRTNPYPALTVLETLPSEELKPYLNFLLDRLTHFNGWIKPSHNLLMYIPRAWLIDNIEKEADILLEEIGDEEQYGMLMLLYEELDSGLAERLAHRALAHPNREIKEIGQEYFDKINGNPG